MLKQKLTSEMFTEFSESVLLEHKNNKNMYDECIDIYSKTQFFDITHTNKQNDYKINIDDNDNKNTQIIIRNLFLGLPFDSVFVKRNRNAIFLRDFSINRITGCYIQEIITTNIDHTENLMVLKQPFNITHLFNDLIINVDFSNIFNNLPTQYMSEYEITNFKADVMNSFLCTIENVAEVFEKLNKKTVLIDEPTQNKPKYYRYKDKAKGTLKVNTRPIYIVLDEEKINKKCDYNKIHKQGILKRDFSFPVIGHWRRLSDNRHLGKDRQGNYNVQGYTWVKSFIKGNKDGIMQQRERIVL